MMHIIDHNILIDIAQQNENGKRMLAAIERLPQSFCIVNIGASELRKGGIRPDRYDLFEKFLSEIKIDKIKRLDPLGLIDITFIGHFIICSNKDAALYESLKKNLFPDGYKPGINMIHQKPYKPIERKRLNQICDAVSLWCHIKYKTESFITRDSNFHRKANQLKTIFGANITHPRQFI